MAVQVFIRDRAVIIEGELTIYFAAEIKAHLIDALEKVKEPLIELHLKQVSDLDTAGLQLLLMARSVASAAGRVLAIRAPSSTVVEVFELCGLQEWLHDGLGEAA